MDRDSFLFYKSYFDAAQKIPVKQRLKFYETVINYGLTGTEPEDTGDALIDMALNFIRPLIKANIQNYLNGCKGGAPKGNKNAEKNNPKTTQNQPKNKGKQGNVTDTVKDTVTVKVTDTVTDTVTELKEAPAEPNDSVEKELDYLYDLLDKLPLDSDERKAAFRRIGELEKDE